jgi:hypothetical protein
MLGKTAVPTQSGILPPLRRSGISLPRAAFFLTAPTILNQRASLQTETGPDIGLLIDQISGRTSFCLKISSIGLFYVAFVASVV